jgi:hypothetical protein
MAENDAASILFPNDAPKAAAPPAWFTTSQNQAEARLSGQHSGRDEQASAMFPNEGKAAEDPAPAGKDDDKAAAIFKDERTFDPEPVKNFVSGFALTALADGDVERARELEAAGDALAADFEAAGSDGKDLAEALDIVRQRQGDTLAGPISDETIEAERVSSLNELRSAGVSDQDLDRARKFVADLDRVAPGTIHSLTATGAGNDLKVIRAAVREAKRRGY